MPINFEMQSTFEYKNAIMPRSILSRQGVAGALFRPLVSGIIGITLMLPAVVFLFTLLARLFVGTKAPYYFIAPSFLQSPFDLFAFHKAQFIIGGLLIAAVCNSLAILRFRLQKGPHSARIGISIRHTCLNSAIALQSVLLLIVLTAYTFIQHLRY